MAAFWQRITGRQAWGSIRQIYDWYLMKSWQGQWFDFPCLKRPPWSTPKRAPPQLVSPHSSDKRHPGWQVELSPCNTKWADLGLLWDSVYKSMFSAIYPLYTLYLSLPDSHIVPRTQLGPTAGHQLLPCIGTMRVSYRPKECYCLEDSIIHLRK